MRVSYESNVERTWLILFQCVYVRHVNRMVGVNRMRPRATCELRAICKLRVFTCDLQTRNGMSF